jgi:hypothetical protein
MNMDNISLIAAILLPFWNLPLIYRVIRRGTSSDISLWWAWGVWACMILMLPKGITSADIIFKAFTISNTVLFTIVLLVVMIYHNKSKRPAQRL